MFCLIALYNGGSISYKFISLENNKIFDMYEKLLF